MITQIFHNESVQRFYGLSTDTKPTDCDNGSTFVEVDTCDAFIFNGAAKTWAKIPADGGGTTDYSDLENKPSINNVTLVGNKTLADLGIPNPLIIKGRVDSVSELPSNADPGWFYFVGLSSAADLEEYVYTEDHRWEFLGYNIITVDSALSSTSENPVQNRVITTAITPISENEYDSLVTKDKPVYFIYD